MLPTNTTNINPGAHCSQVNYGITNIFWFPETLIFLSNILECFKSFFMTARKRFFPVITDNCSALSFFIDFFDLLNQDVIR
jgi:hypothetical protein